jgi:hypothetical protein
MKNEESQTFEHCWSGLHSQIKMNKNESFESREMTNYHMSNIFNKNSMIYFNWLLLVGLIGCVQVLKKINIADSSQTVGIRINCF